MRKAMARYKNRALSIALALLMLAAFLPVPSLAASEAAQTVMNRIDTLPEAAEVTLDISLQYELEGTLWAYETLTTAQKEEVSAAHLAKLEAVEGAFETLIALEDLSTVTEDTTLNWSQFMGNPGQMGVSDGKSAASGDELAEMWRFNIAKSASDWAATPGTPIVVGDYVYCYIAKQIRKFRLSDGLQVAKGEAPGEAMFFINLTYGDGKIFVPRLYRNAENRLQTNVIAYDAETLEQLFVTAPFPSTGQAEGYTSYYEGHIYLSQYSSGGSFAGYPTTDTDPSTPDEVVQPAWIDTVDNTDSFSANIGAAFVNGACIYATGGRMGSGTSSVRVRDAFSGELLQSFLLPEGEKVASSLVYNDKNNRIYISATKSGAGMAIHSYNVNGDGTLNLENALDYLSPVNGGGTQSTPLIYNDRLYIGGGGGTMGSNEPFHVIDANTLQDIYTIDIKSKGSSGLTTAYATMDNEQTVYVYMVPYAPVSNQSQLWIIKDSIGQTEPDYEIVSGIGEAQYASQSVIVAHDGSLVYYNDAKGLYCYGNIQDTAITSTDVARQISRIPAPETYPYYNQTEVSRIRERYEALAASEKELVSNLSLLEAAEGILALSGEALVNYAEAAAAALPSPVTLDDASAVYSAQFWAKRAGTEPSRLRLSLMALNRLLSGYEGEPLEEPVTAYIRIERDNDTYLPRQEITLTHLRTLSSYGVKGVSADEEPDFVTPVHLVSEAFEQAGIENDIELRGGWVVEFAGLGSNLMYYANNEDIPTLFTEYKVQNLDDINIIQTGYSSAGYTGLGYFLKIGDDDDDPAEQVEAETTAGQPVTLTYFYKGWDVGAGFAENAPVYVSEKDGDRATIKTDIQTDENGQLSISFAEPGTYIVSARAYAEPEETTRLASNPYCRIIVSETSLQRLKDLAVAELEAYKDPADYREAQKLELAEAIAEGKAAIDAAEDAESVEAAKLAAMSIMDAVKTDAQLTEEEQGVPLDEPITAYIRVERDNDTYLPRQEITLTHLRTLNSYGVKGISIEDEPGYVTPLHLLSEALLQGGIDNDIVMMGAGWVLGLCGMDANIMYYVDGVDHPSAFGGYRVATGNDIAVIQTNYTSAGYTGFGAFGELNEDPSGGYDPYYAIEQTEATVLTGMEVRLAYSYHGWGVGCGYAANAPVYVSEKGGDRATVKTDLRTDSDGWLTISFDEPGVYIVSARAYADAAETERLASNPYCKVTVIDNPLPSLLEEAYLKEETDYTTSSWPLFASALANVESLLAQENPDPAEIIEAYAALSTAMNGLVRRGSTIALEAYITLCENNYAEESYSPASWAIYSEALAAAKAICEDNSDSSEGDVNLALRDLQNACAQLVRQNKTALALWLDIAEEILADRDNYVSGAILALEAAYENGLEVYNNPDASQEEINEAVELLQAAVEGSLKRGDKTSLLALVNSIVDLQETNYTPSTWAIFFSARQYANEVLMNLDASEYEVAEAEERLYAGIVQLLVRADFSQLNLAIASVEAILEARELYAPVTLEGLEEELADAKLVSENMNSTQEEVDEALASLVNKLGVVRLKAKKEALDDAVKQARSLDLSRYTYASVSALNTVLADSDRILEDDNVTQDEVDEAEVRVKNAVNALVENTTQEPNPKPVEPEEPAGPTEPASPSEPEAPREPEENPDPVGPHEPGEGPDPAQEPGEAEIPEPEIPTAEPPQAIEVEEPEIPLDGLPYTGGRWPVQPILLIGLCLIALGCFLPKKRRTSK